VSSNKKSKLACNAPSGYLFAIACKHTAGLYHAGSSHSEEVVSCVDIIANRWPVLRLKDNVLHPLRQCGPKSIKTVAAHHDQPVVRAMRQQFKVFMCRTFVVQSLKQRRVLASDPKSMLPRSYTIEYRACSDDALA
jgi:hypothetical protein